MPSYKMNSVLGTLKPTDQKGCMVIAIAGLSASGKTTLAQDLAETLNAALLQMDDYYRDIPAGREVQDLNWDHPDMFHLDEWRSNLETLANGYPAQVPKYCFRNSYRNGAREVKPSSVIVAEGQFALHPNAIPNHNCLNIFVEMDIESALSRRIARDTTERGRTEESIRQQWNQHVVPSWNNWVEPSRLRADLIIRGDVNRTQNLRDATRAVAESQAKFAYLR